MSDVLLEVEDLKTYFYTDEGVAQAVDGVSFTIRRGQTLGLVGESGCGKSVTALSIMRLVPPPGRIVGGRITLYQDGKPTVLTEIPEREMRQLRGAAISMIFQEPMTSLNPVFTIGYQIMEALLLHNKNMTRQEARQRAIQMLRQVQIGGAEQAVDAYPHQFSGGMRQRAMIAMALACGPELLIADEPTTALDVTVQAQILDLLRKLQSGQMGWQEAAVPSIGQQANQHKLSLLLITHDLGVVAEMANEVAVMYAGQIVERGSVDRLFSQQLHPYTYLLLRSRPALGVSRSRKLPEIPGEVPSAKAFPPGCRFHPRCPFAKEICRTTAPELCDHGSGHWARCHFAGEIEFAAWEQTQGLLVQAARS
jgi:peptide/nickel transport system ATP-binding protein